MKHRGLWTVGSAAPPARSPGRTEGIAWLRQFLRYLAGQGRTVFSL